MSSSTSSDMIIYEKMRSKIAQHYVCKMREEKDKTLLQVVNSSIERHQARIFFLQKILYDVAEACTKLKSIYQDKTDQYKQFDTCSEDYEEYYESLNTSYEVISANLESRKTYISKDIKTSQEKLNKEIDDKDILEFINKMTESK